MLFCPIASGSDGNSIYVGTKSTHILIDVGITGKKLEAGLNMLLGSRTEPDAIFVTHEHSDHIQGVGVISRRFDVPVYATAKTWLRIDRHSMLGKIAQKNRHTVYPGEPCLINDICLCAFETSHDSAEPVGYTILADGYKAAVATDLGYVSDSVRDSVRGADLLLLESNHDIEMLKNGPYPRELKERVLSRKGHLSNVSAGEFLAEIANTRLKHVYLGHLSRENNSPLIAMDTVTRVLDSRGALGMELMLAHRGTPSAAVELTSTACS